MVPRCVALAALVAAFVPVSSADQAVVRREAGAPSQGASGASLIAEQEGQRQHRSKHTAREQRQAAEAAAFTARFQRLKEANQPTPLQKVLTSEIQGFKSGIKTMHSMGQRAALLAKQYRAMNVTGAAASRRALWNQSASLLDETLERLDHALERWSPASVLEQAAIVGSLGDAHDKVHQVVNKLSSQPPAASKVAELADVSARATSADEALRRASVSRARLTTVSTLSIKLRELGEACVRRSALGEGKQDDAQSLASTDEKPQELVTWFNSLVEKVGSTSATTGTGPSRKTPSNWEDGFSTLCQNLALQQANINENAQRLSALVQTVASAAGALPPS